MRIGEETYKNLIDLSNNIELKMSNEKKSKSECIDELDKFINDNGFTKVGFITRLRLYLFFNPNYNSFSILFKHRIYETELKIKGSSNTNSFKIILLIFDETVRLVLYSPDINKKILDTKKCSYIKKLYKRFALGYASYLYFFIKEYPYDSNDIQSTINIYIEELSKELKNHLINRMEG